MTRDADFLSAFESCTLPEAEWTHVAHVRMAWLYLGALPFPEALERIRGGIQRYNASLGKGPAYHDTVTIAYAHLVADRMRLPVADFEVFRAENGDLFDRSQPPTLGYYRKETLLSPEARAGFVEPDLAPLPVPP